MQRLSYELMKALSVAKVAGTEPTTTILDVRGTDEVSSTGMISGAVNIPLDQLEAAVKKSAEDFNTAYAFAKPAPANRIVTYCLKGGRAEKAAGILTAGGYTNVDIYPGSWTEWAARAAKE